MKIAYNNCFGGFGLSEEAFRELAKLKGVSLEGANMHYNSFIKNGEIVIDIPADRTDVDLIKVIETLGDRANGMCAELAIEQIPDGAEYEITEYDGNESVVPPRQTW